MGEPAGTFTKYSSSIEIKFSSLKLAFCNFAPEPMGIFQIEVAAKGHSQGSRVPLYLVAPAGALPSAGLVDIVVELTFESSTFDEGEEGLLVFGADTEDE